MKIAIKYAYYTKTIALVVFYLPILPIGVIMSSFGVILVYLIEKYHIYHFYKKPERINGEITREYLKLFRYIIFIYALSVFIFLGGTYNDRHTNWELIGLILFACLALVSVSSFFKFFKFVKFLNVKKCNTKPYEDFYFDTAMNYEMTNPITRHKGFERYLEKLLDSKIISQKEFDDYYFRIDSEPSDIIELYYAKKFGSKPDKNYRNKMKKIKKMIINRDYTSNFNKDEHKYSYLNKLKNSGNLGKGISKLVNEGGIFYVEEDSNKSDVDNSKHSDEIETINIYKKKEDKQKKKLNKKNKSNVNKLHDNDKIIDPHNSYVDDNKFNTKANLKESNDYNNNNNQISYLNKNDINNNNININNENNNQYLLKDSVNNDYSINDSDNIIIDNKSNLKNSNLNTKTKFFRNSNDLNNNNNNNYLNSEENHLNALELNNDLNNTYNHNNKPSGFFKETNGDIELNKNYSNYNKNKNKKKNNKQ